jgi:hypothetical protein
MAALPGVGIFGSSPAALLLVPALKVLVDPTLQSKARVLQTYSLTHVPYTTTQSDTSNSKN